MHRRSVRTAAAFMMVVLCVSGATSLGAQPAQASQSVSVTPAAQVFDKNLIMDNAVFEDTTTMSVAQIQAFLNGFSNSCVKNYKAPNPLTYSTYSTTPVSAAQVISTSANMWGVNPQVLLATLEKEQTLVSGGAGCDQWRYWSAMGYNCPDAGGQYNYPDLGITSTCVQNKGNAGFSAQMSHAAWQLQFNRQRADGNISWNGSGSTPNYGYYTKGFRQQTEGAASIYYDGTATIDGQSVTITNGATATLYTYTPHISANQNFVSIFSNWFGSTLQVRVDYTNYIKGVYRVLLGRPADAAGLAYWANLLGSNSTTTAYFVNTIVTGREYTARTVAADYLLLLKRAGDGGGIAFWANQLSSTRRNDLTLANLAASDEYFSARSSQDIPTFVSNLYIDLLGRSTDGGGLNYWSGLISGGTITRGAFALMLADSPEYSLRLVNSVYNLVLGRDADSAGRQYWADRYVQSQDILQLVISLATSTEGKSHLAAA